MKKQILIIHGGRTFNKDEDYLNYLKALDVHLERYLLTGWKKNLQKNLADKFDVFLPEMPNKTNARYEEWKLMFERIAMKLDDEVILIGHSMGGIFLAKYLAENKFKKKIKALYILSAPFHVEGMDEDLGDFRLPSDLSAVPKQVSNIFIYHSADDPIVPFEHAELFKKEWPGAELVRFEDRHHFIQEEFGEFEEAVRKFK